MVFPDVAQVNRTGIHNDTSGVRSDPGTRFERAIANPDAQPSREEALDVLFLRHFADLVRLAFCMVGDRHRAEDVVKDAFVATYWQSDGRWEPDDAVARLRFEVLHRCRSRTRVLTPLKGPGVVPAVRALPRRQREVVMCLYYLGLTPAQTAHVLGTGIGSVNLHLRRAVLSLLVSTEAIP